LTVGFEAKPPETVAAGFEAKPPESVTTGFEAKPAKTVAAGFEAKPVETVVVGFDAKPLETVATGFKAKLLETVATGFDVKPVKTVRVVLRLNHSQTIDLGFEAQLRNLCSSSPHARCRPHTASPDCPAIEYPTCATISGPLHQVSYSCHGPRCCTSCRTCHLHTMRQATVILQRNKDKRKTKQNYPGFEFKPRQVNDSSQSNQETNNLVSHTVGPLAMTSGGKPGET
jgi:hypothetical protein